MPDKFEQETIAAALGATTVAVGSSFTLLPGLVGRAFGHTKEASGQAGALLTVRSLGFRDIALGLGLLLSRNEAKSNRLWLRLFSLCMAGDVIACLLAMRKPGANVVTFLGTAASLVLGTVAWLVGQEKEQDR